MRPHRIRFTRLIRAGLAAVFMGIAPRIAAAATSDLPTDSTGVTLDHFDYAVPDAPAFKLLEVDSKSILRPGTRREVGVILDKADFSNFAVECAPFLVGRDGQLSRKEYLHNRWLYNLRLSIGARTKDSGPTNAAVGLRLNFLDSHDPYVNKPLVDAAYSVADDIDHARVQAEDSVRINLTSAKTLALFPVEWQDSIRVWRSLKFENTEIFAGLPAEVREPVIDKLTDRQITAARARFAKARETFKNQWNQDIFELGMATAGAGSDSLLGKSQVNAYGSWLVAGFGWGSRAQWLMGGNYGLERSKTNRKLDASKGGAGARFYYGSNFAKAALSFDLSGKRHDPTTYTGDLGAELNVLPGLWVIASVGLKGGTNDATSLTSQVSVRYANLPALPIPGLLRSGPPPK